jgi:hypothetical protein
VKLGTENKTKTIAAAVLVVFAIFMLARTFTGGGETPAPSGTSTAATKAPAASSRPGKRKQAADRAKAQPVLAETLDPTLRFDLLKSSEEVTYKGSGRDIFHSQAAPSPADIPKPIVNPATVIASTPPPPPPINLKLYGYAQHKNGEAKRIFLSSGEDIFVAKEGDIVNRRYKILKINNNSVDVEDVLTNNRQTLYLTQG